MLTPEPATPETVDIQSEIRAPQSESRELDLRQIQRIWKQCVLEPQDAENSSILNMIKAIGCGFERAILCHGHHLQCDALIQVAIEQAAAMKAIRAFTDRAASFYIDLFPSHDLLYFRQVMVVAPDGETEPTDSRPFYFVAVGNQQAVYDVAHRVNTAIDESLGWNQDGSTPAEKEARPVSTASEQLHLQGYRLHLVRDPATSLSAADQDVLIRQCVPVARAAFKNEGVTESDILLHAIQVSIAIYAYDAKTDELVAFATLALKKERKPPVIYLEGTVIGPQAQGRGLYDILIAVRVLAGLESLDPARNDRVLVCTRTQNPVVFRAMSTKLGLYPRMDEPTPQDVTAALVDFAQIVRDEHSDFVSEEYPLIDSPTLVVQRAYGYRDEQGREHGVSMEGDNVSRTGDEKIDAYISKHLVLKNGDAFLMGGWCDRHRALEVLDAGLAKVSPEDHSLLDRFAAFP